MLPVALILGPTLMLALALLFVRDSVLGLVQGAYQLFDRKEHSSSP
jgi:hypothetical protein